METNPEQPNDAQQGSPAESPAAGSAPARQRDERPRPEYGEYAPEGWEWSPEGDDTADSQQASPGYSAPAAAGTSAAAAHGAIPTSQGTRLPGVPHNLGLPGGSAAAPGQAPTYSTGHTTGAGMPGTGVSGTTTPTTPLPGTTPTHSTPGSASTQSGPGAPYRAQGVPHASPGADPHRAPHAPAYLAAPGAVSGTPGAAKPRTADRVVTIILLALGALGALYNADSLYRIESQLMLLANMLEIDGFSVPDWVSTMGIVGALVILALYAVTVIASIQRLRAKKLTFWLPLSAGVIAGIIVFALTMVAYTTSPELIERLSDPNALNDLMTALSETPQ